MKRVLVAIALVFATVALAACGQHSASVPRGAAVVQVQRMAFRPQVVHVAIGQSVAWRFDDAGVLHNVASVGDTILRSPNQDSGIWVHTFSTPGVIHYRCSIHPYMTGEVVVGS